jgi:hypothetical protein
MLGVVRRPMCWEISIFDKQHTLLSRHFCRIYNKWSTTLQPESIDHAHAIVQVIKQNQAFNQKGGSMFTFNLCSLEPYTEDAYSLLALADPSPEQARYQRIRGMRDSRHPTKNNRKMLPNVRPKSIKEKLRRNISHHIKYSYIRLFVNYCFK